MNLSFFDGIVGGSIPESTINTIYDDAKNRRIYKHPLSHPEIGCYLSHYEIWRRAVFSESAWTVVLEDDFEADDSFKSVISEIEQLDMGPTVVKLNEARSTWAGCWEKLTVHHRLGRPWTVSARTTGYVINRAAARHLVDRALPFFRPVDIDLKHWWEFDVEMLVVKPAIVRERSGLASAISAQRNAQKARGGRCVGRRFLRNLAYQCRFHAGLSNAHFCRWLRKFSAPRSSVN
jgi:glycosyl transferase family 25